MNFDEYLEEALKDEDLKKEYDKLIRKQVRITCHKCGNVMIYKNYWSWIFHTLFHRFSFSEWRDYRRVKCPNCGEFFYAKREKNRHDSRKSD